MNSSIHHNPSEENIVNQFICHRHQTRGQQYMMFREWCDTFRFMLEKMPNIQHIKVTERDIQEKSQSVNIQVRTSEKKPKQHKPYNISQATLADAFKQVGL